VTPVEALFVKGKLTERCCLVLSGQLRITCSDDDLESEAGPWSILALQALVDVDYAPDYAAEVITTARLLFITRAQYESMLISSSEEAGSGGRADSKWVDRIRSGVAAEAAAHESGSRHRSFDWDASSCRGSGAPSVVESASSMLSRPPRLKGRSQDDLEAYPDSMASIPFVMPSTIARSQSHPELMDGDDEDQRPLCEILADTPSTGGRAIFDLSGAPLPSRSASGLHGMGSPASRGHFS
jgi:hypothetical protein